MMFKKICFAGEWVKDRGLPEHLASARNRDVCRPLLPMAESRVAVPCACGCRVGGFHYWLIVWYAIRWLDS